MTYPIPKEEMPFERYAMYGAENLSESELLAIFLRSGTKTRSACQLARDILLKCEKDYGKGLQALFTMSLEELKELPGIGHIKAVQIKCLGEICKRMNRPAMDSRKSYKTPESVAEYYMDILSHLEYECVHLMCLDTKGCLVKEKRISMGSIKMSLIPPREIFLEALQTKAVNIILIHNHPSGEVTPSKKDIECTRQIADLGKLLDIPLLDHIIIGNHQFYSFRQEKIL